MQYTFIAPLNNDPEDNESLTTKTEVSFLNCRSYFPDPSPPAGDNSEFWNCNVCPNDDKYCQPFISGDQLYFQLPYQPFYSEYGTIGPFFYVVVDGIPTEVTSGITTQVGIGTNEINYINVILDTSDPFFVDKDCFYLQVALQSCDIGQLAGVPSPEPFESCYMNRLAENGNDIPEAIKHCFYTVCSDKYNTEFFCKVRCEEQTILVQGSYLQQHNGRRPAANFNITDCSGKYHGLLDINGFTVFNLFLHSYRVRGIVENAGYEFEETKIKNKKIKSTQREGFVLFTKKIPYYVAKQIAACFNSRELTIDGQVYTGTIKLSKNFEEGNMWIIKENIYIECDEIDFSCGT